MKNVLYLIVFTIISFQSLAQIKNNGFENWTSQPTNLDSLYLIEELGAIATINGAPNYWAPEYENFNSGIARTINSYKGDYAALIYTWYHHNLTTITYKDALQGVPKYINGYYKLIGNKKKTRNPQAIVTITIRNTVGDTMSSVTHYLDTTSVYKNFSIELNNHYISTDSIFIAFTNSNLQTCIDDSSFATLCDFLFVDEIELSHKTSVSVKEIKTSDFIFYPNPTNGIVSITNSKEISQIQVYNSLGSLIEILPSDNQIDITHFEDGCYFLQSLDRNGNPLRIDKILKRN